MRNIGAFLPFAAVFSTGIALASAEPSLRATSLAPLKQFMASLASPLAQARLVEANVPTVACQQDGQVGPQIAPILPKSVRVIVLEGTAVSLAFYSAHESVGSGVLAPRGWDCFGVYGSSGSTLYVVPHWPGGRIRDGPRKVKNGPAVINTVAIGETSGRYYAVKISARIFPRARAYAESVREIGADDPNNYVFAPWPADRLNYLSDFKVTYVTPARADGLGTQIGLVPAGEPILGLVYFSDGEDDSPYVEQLAVRLDRGDQRRYAAIVAAKIGAMESFQPAKTATVSPQEMEPSSKPNPRATRAIARLKGGSKTCHVRPPSIQSRQGAIEPAIELRLTPGGEVIEKPPANTEVDILDIVTYKGQPWGLVEYGMPSGWVPYKYVQCGHG
jgi:hypothetical protein